LNTLSLQVAAVVAIYIREAAAALADFVQPLGMR